MVAAFFGIPWWALLAVVLVEEENDKQQDAIPDKLRKPKKPLPPRVPLPPGETHRKIVLDYNDDPKEQRFEINPDMSVGVALLYPPRMVPKQAGRDVWLCWRGGFATECPLEAVGDVSSWYGNVKASKGSDFVFFMPSMQRIGDTLYIKAWPWNLGAQDFIYVHIWQR